MRDMKIYVLSVLVMAMTLLNAQNNYPYSTNNQSITVWNGVEYVPFFMKGVNLGIAVPGTFPGEMAATSEDYSKWFQEIKDAGFNCIRIYTLHYPRFFHVLDSFNTANPQNPLLFLQGVWLEEEIPNYDHDLHSLTSYFEQEIEENVDCVHGNRVIPPRLGKAYGTYDTDVSKWCLGYIIGREIYPIEVETTNNQNSETGFTGNHFSVANTASAESWLVARIDHLATYEQDNYNTQRPISASSWPTLDPLEHPEEVVVDEDSQSIDLSGVELTDAPAGFFISYHAYPYYPDFVSEQSDYQSFSDDYGVNSYLGYLNDLKSHYPDFPLIIAEYGVPSSWVVAHFSTNGMNHGGFDEYNQGLTNIRLLNNIQEANCGGGIQFAWIDEWFKKTWVTDPIDYIADSRILWHNLASAEQNFGLVAFDKTFATDTLVSYNANENITFIHSEVNESALEITAGLKGLLDGEDEVWLAIDTYADELGELLLPSGDTIPFRSEFILQITNYSAKLYVTEAYDLFAIWHNQSSANQLYHSTATNGAPWKLVRIKNNHGVDDVQYIGNLQVNNNNQPYSSKDGVTFTSEGIHVKIPWTYLNMVSPDQLKVFHDYKATPEKEDTISTGINIGVYSQGEWFHDDQRLSWEPWTTFYNNPVNERLKTSYYIMKNNLHLFNTKPFGLPDTFAFNNLEEAVSVGVDSSVMNNDFDLDGETLLAYLSSNPANGQIVFNTNGSFNYTPNIGFEGVDSLSYVLYDGQGMSLPTKVYLNISNNFISVQENEVIANIFPNPVQDQVNIESEEIMNEVLVYDMNGRLLKQFLPNQDQFRFDCPDWESGNYIIVVKTADKAFSSVFFKK